MKKISIFIVLILFSLLYWVLSRELVHEYPLKHQSEMVPANKSIIVHQAKYIKRENKVKIVELPPKSIQEKGMKIHPQEQMVKQYKEARMVRARVEGKKVIGFGDVLLGELDDNDMENVSEYVNIELSGINLWESNRIHYQIEKGMKNEKEIKQAIKIINDMTVMEFTPFSSPDQDGIVFKTGDKNCYSYVGKVAKVQPIYLAPECDATAIMHEMLHSLGFIHEQSRADRNNYLEVLWDNIDPKYYIQYQMVPENYMVTVEGTNFDFSSIMLYKPFFFAKKEGLITMKPIGDQEIIPVENTLSPIDIERIDRLYAP